MSHLEDIRRLETVSLVIAGDAVYGTRRHAGAHAAER